MTTLVRSSIPPRPERLFTVEEYLRMIDTGILTKRDKVELLEGRIVEKMPTDPPHVLAMELVAEALKNACTPVWIIRTDSPLQLEKSAPEPDIMVIRGPRQNYAHRHPAAQDALLVVEIFDSTLRDDRGEMAQIYAAAGIPFYWIVNLVDRRVEVHANPTGPHHFPAYHIRQDFNETDTLSLQFPDGPKVDLRASGMFPPSKR